MAKKRGLKMITKAVKKTVRAASAKNPPFWSETFFVVAPAVGTYVVTRLAGRAARAYLGPRYPKARAYIPLAGSLAAAGAMYFACTQVSDLKKYKTAVLVGSGIAITQSLLLAVAPQLGWLFDVGAPRAALAGPTRAQQPLLAADAALDRLEAQAAAQAPVEEADASQEELAGADGGLGADELGPEDLAAAGWVSPLNAN
jgi:hypothetical protein